ncbi:PREDICTED: secretagogin [Elephantulus edwardii]|uniref:secretagogin n=1 Tax=Elephantulus edwardii TaxID=28737 RepID=UPI0003F0E115|nr:PREDICTED: secretagogin [Elephantulus edwardii]
MDSAHAMGPGRLDATGFWKIWQLFDVDEKGYIEEREVDAFFCHMLTKLGADHFVIFFKLKNTQLFASAEYFNHNNRLWVHQQLPACRIPGNSKQLPSMSLAPGSSSPAGALPQQAAPRCGPGMKIFDKNQDGRLDLNDLARILALQENFLLQFKMDACSTEERKRDFEKIFAHYDVSKTGALEGPEVDGFVKDMMELVKPSISGVDLDKFREILLRHCDVNKDGKIQKTELALCLGLKINP